MSGMDAVVVALISGAVTLLGVLIANSRSQAVTETKLDELTREVREHNNFARRMPVVEEPNGLWPIPTLGSTFLIR